MKKRSGFVSNSSSSSFIITCPPPESIKTWFVKQTPQQFIDQKLETIYWENSWSIDEERWKAADTDTKIQAALLYGHLKDDDVPKDDVWIATYDDAYHNPPIGDELEKANISFEYSRD